MRKLFYISASLILILSSSSCSKQCVQCHATDKYGVVVNTSNVICDGPLDRKTFEDRYGSEFSGPGYTTTCANVNN